MHYTVTISPLDVDHSSLSVIVKSKRDLKYEANTLNSQLSFLRRIPH